MTRYLDENRQTKYDYHLSNAASDTPLEELARVSKAEHLVENGLKRAKSEAGLSDYETRTWSGWYHHQILSLIATWFLIREARRKKKYTPAITVPLSRTLLDIRLRQACDRYHPGWEILSAQRKSIRKEVARFYHYKKHNLLPPRRLKQRA